MINRNSSSEVDDLQMSIKKQKPYQKFHYNMEKDVKTLSW